MSLHVWRLLFDVIVSFTYNYDAKLDSSLDTQHVPFDTRNELIAFISHVT